MLLSSGKLVAHNRAVNSEGEMKRLEKKKSAAGIVALSAISQSNDLIIG